MSERAQEFLTEWTLKQDTAPLTRSEAEQVAERWEVEALENGIAGNELRAAAHGDVADYLLRTFGEP